MVHLQIRDCFIIGQSIIKRKLVSLQGIKVQTWKTADDGSDTVQMVKEVPSEEVFRHISPNEYSIKPLHGNRDKEI